MNQTFESGDLIRCRWGGKDFSGVYVTERDGSIVVKLSNGYNIGIPLSVCSIEQKSEDTNIIVKTIEQDKSLPVLSIISTGGTIASRIDYRTGAVTSQFDAEDIVRTIPGLAGIAQYRARRLYNIHSENMTPSIWQELAREIYDEIKDGTYGVIVTHGTDTLAYSASAVSFMLDSPVPIVFVGSQRSADRPSSDNVMNALCSAKACVSHLGEVAVVMHSGSSDDRCSIHRATRVRKMHTSRRDAFQTISGEPLGHIEYPSLEVSLNPHTQHRNSKELSLNDKMDKNCALLYFYPGMDPSVIKRYEDCHGLVIAGTGLGHVNSGLIREIGHFIGTGGEVVMTSQCLHGRVCDRVYDTGRDLLLSGVIEGEEMLPETALVKLMWVLGNANGHEEVRSLMQSNLKGEFRMRSFYGL